MRSSLHILYKFLIIAVKLVLQLHYFVSLCGFVVSASVKEMTVKLVALCISVLLSLVAGQGKLMFLSKCL